MRATGEMPPSGDSWPFFMRCGIRKKAHSSLQQPRMDGPMVSVNRSIAHRRSEIGLGAVEDAWTRSAAPASRPKEMASDVLCGLLIACRARKVGEASQPIMLATNVSKMHAIQMEWDHVWL